MKRALLVSLIALGIGFGLWMATRKPAAPAEIHSIGGHAMGSQWTLKWRGEAPPNLQQDIAQVLESWQQVMSQWRMSSDLSRFNRGEPATEELLRVIRLAERIREATGGAFNHEILQDVYGAGYGPPGKGVDLSAIGKGFAADRVGDRMRQLGIREFIFEIGGDLLAGEGDWTVGIEHPDPAKGGLLRNVTLSNRALATSGNTYQPTHIIDPRSHKPVERPPMTVSVIAADGATADAWATAMFVLGPEFKDIPEGLEVTWNR